MNKVSLHTLRIFDKEVINCIIDKYGFDEMQAINDYFTSQTYQLLIDKSLEFYKVSPLIIFDLWEAEKVTGNPHNSQYIRNF